MRETYLQHLQIAMMVANDVELADQVLLRLLQTTLKVLVHPSLLVDSINVHKLATTWICPHCATYF